MSDDHGHEGKTETVVSRRLLDGTLVETLYVPEERVTKLAVENGDGLAIAADWTAPDGTLYVPVPAKNNLIRHAAVLLPSDAEDYGTVLELVEDIREYLHRYVDLSSRFERIVGYYVLLTWVYDAFNELPYLRLRGDFGTGKSRALVVLGSICYKPFFASGASTVSPIFHTLDTFRGTLILDEADFRFSDEKTELVKIFNNGNAKGFPVLRTATSVRREFDPRAFDVYGPKIVAMRRSFDDHALESRFLTETMGQRPMRADIPISLPAAQKDEALSLRNRLLRYRFDNVRRMQADEGLADPAASPRLNQILIPLLSVIDDPSMRNEVRASMKEADQALFASRSASAEAGVLEVLAELFERPDETRTSIFDITALFTARFGREYEYPITNRFIGGLLRNRLHLVTYKSHGIYVIPISEKPKVKQLCLRYGVAEDGGAKPTETSDSTSSESGGDPG